METIEDILNDFCGSLNDCQREHIRRRVLKSAEVAGLRDALDQLWTAATDYRRVPTSAPFLMTLEAKREAAHRVLLETAKP